MINECGSVTTGGLTGWWEARFRPSLVTNANKEKKKKKNLILFLSSIFSTKIMLDTNEERIIHILYLSTIINDT